MVQWFLQEERRGCWAGCLPCLQGRSVECRTKVGVNWTQGKRKMSSAARNVQKGKLLCDWSSLLKPAAGDSWEVIQRSAFLADTPND